MDGVKPMRLEVAGAGSEKGDAAAVVAAGRRGCIRMTRGPWMVRREGRGGKVTTSLRNPTERERENNRQRERRRRQVATRIYAGLRAHAGYELPKHADQNDVLRALCAEAGYLVDDEGNVARCCHQRSSGTGTGDGASGSFDNLQPSSYSGATEEAAGSIHQQPEPEPEQKHKISLELTLSFTYM